MVIRPIITDADHVRALRYAETLWDAADGSPESYELDALATLIDAYERKKWPARSSDPVEVLMYAILEMGRSQADLAKILGSNSRASEILNRKRALTVEMIDKIGRQWGVPVSLLAKPYRLAVEKNGAALKIRPKKRRRAAAKTTKVA